MIKLSRAKVSELRGMSSEEQRLVLSELGRRDLWFFARNVLGYNLLNESLHGAFARELQGRWRNFLGLLPRGHLKTTLGTHSFVLWQLVRNQNLRFLIANATLDNAKSMLREIRAHIEQNEMFRWLYPEVSKDERVDKWTDSEIQIRRDKFFKEATVSVVGVGGNLVSKHYDWILKDDLVNDKNVSTDEQIRKVIDWNRASESLLEPDGRTVMLGTRWHYADLYGHILDEERGRYRVYIRKAIEDGKPIFPERFTLERLAEIRSTQGTYLYSGQYNNSPIDESHATFRREWLRFYEDAPQGLRIFITVDPAISQRQSADYTGISVVGVDYMNIVYVLEVVQKRLTPRQILDEIFRLHNVWKPDTIGIETIGFQKTLKYNIDARMRASGEYINITEIRQESRESKEKRIRGLQPLVEMGTIKFHKSQQNLIDELLRFPFSKHDDLIDSLSMALQVCFPAMEQKKKEREKPKYSFLWWRDMVINRKKAKSYIGVKSYG